MDAKAVAEAAGVAVGTLNVWIQRGLIPGMTIGSRGRQRNFDLKTAVGIGIIGELVRFGFDAPFASSIVYRAPSAPSPRRKRLLITRKPLTGQPVGSEEYRIFTFDTEGQLPALFQADGERPNAYAVIDLDNIRVRMKQAEIEWRQRRKARGDER
jgi:MerR-like DNA binding protein